MMSLIVKNAMKLLMNQILVAMLLLGCTLSFSQNIQIDNTLTAEQLIQDHLVEGCVQVTNISSPVNGSVNGFSSFGYFERDISNFPFENGIMLTTGNATSGGNATNTNILNDGELSWTTDPDLEAALGITNTHNATTIEFDFVSISNLIQFNYILASEEYFGNFPCEYSDGFAFLIREAGTNNPYTNIALIPGTAIPVNTNTIHDEIVGFCPAENDTFFDGYNLGDTNYNGRTTVMTASANITPNVQYHIKLVIADQSDENYDSAVFIQGNSFNPTVELGPDITTCAEHYDINADIQNPLANYSWFLNGNVIPGEINPILTAVTSGEYQVQISIPLNNDDCIIQDVITITLNSEQTAAPLSNYEVCDDLSNDGIETFDLSTKDAEALASVPASNYNITYHLTSNDAQNDTNPILTPIQNTSNPQPIFVRIEDIDSGCLAFTSFNLIVNSLPDIVSPGNVQLCDDDVADGSTTMDLNDLDSGITQGDTNLAVTYHYTQADANDGINPIPQPYVNTNPNETIFIRVINSTTGCVSNTSFTLEILERPDVDPQSIRDISACEDDGDGFASFDFTETLNDLLASLSDVTITFHLSSEDAENGVNPIGDITNFENTVAETQTIFIRIEDDTTGCYTVVTLNLYANILVSETDFTEATVCDDETADGIAEFDLVSVASNMVNNIDNVTVTFYETQADLDAEINPIDQTTAYQVTSSPHTIFVKLEIPNCERDGEITLVINPPVVLTPIATIDYCDTDDDGFTSIELAELDATVLNGMTDVSNRYFLTETDAINDENGLAAFYTNTTNPQTIYVRVEHDTTGCFDTMPIDINVVPAPTVTQPNTIIICDDDQDSFSIIDLDALIPEIVPNTTDLNISFHNTADDADQDTNAITTPSSYNSTSETIHARVESTITTCYAIVEISVIVNTQPLFPNITPFQQCETDGNQTAEFLFSEKDIEILNGQTGKDVLYFESQTDAENRTNSIDKNTIYTNTSSPQTIYVRVENITDQSCFGVASFELEIGSIPLYNPPTNFIVCDDISNDGVHTFDFNEKIAEISQGSPESLEVTFHSSFDDANNEINALPLSYTNIENPQQIYARIENGTYCHAVAEFGLNVVQIPMVNLPSALETCDDDYDGFSTFDLTVAEFEILDVRDDDIVVTYFESEVDLENDTNQISTPENYTNIENPQTVYVKVLNVLSECYAALALELIVHLPPAVNDIPEIYICDNDSDTFELSNATAILMDSTANTTIAYYGSQGDAENQQNAFGTTYNYITNSDTIFIRVQNDATSCFRIQSFDLIINPNPIANTAPDLEACDDDYDFELVFDLSQQTSLVLGGQDPSQFTVTYHELANEANAGTNAITDLNYNGYDGQEIFVRVENNTTGCYDTSSFMIIVNRKPNVEIEDQVICLDNLPLTVVAGNIVAGDTYLWSTGETTSEIEITQIGLYSVTVITPEGCETTSNFNVSESEQATIELTETVDFSDPNNITITISGSGNYMYSLDNGPLQESNVFNNVSLGYHTVTVIDLNGCGSATIEVLVIDAPKFMTPNGDGYHDTWHIVGVETLPGTTITIFDRYGKQLAYLTSSSEGWNGTYNGAHMPSNDYWFVASVVQGNKSFEYRGHFALKR